MFESDRQVFLRMFDRLLGYMSQEAGAFKLIAFAIYLVALAIYTKKEK